MKKLILSSVLACSITTSSFAQGVAEDTKKDLGPVASFELFQKDLTSGNISSLWDSFPKAYRNDIEGIIHTFADKVDPDIYNCLLYTSDAADD